MNYLHCFSMFIEYILVLFNYIFNLFTICYSFALNRIDLQVFCNSAFIDVRIRTPKTQFLRRIAGNP